MKIAICGLGLIGGSMARAYKAAGHTVLGIDTNKETMGFALENGICDGVLKTEDIKTCDLLIIAICPNAAIKYLHSIAPYIGSGCTVIDICGTKRDICREGFALAKEHGFRFCGTHPMAGLHFSGIHYSRADLFKGASMVLVPPEDAENDFIEQVEELLAPAKFGRFTVCDPYGHDRMIAYTSQLAHVVSNAYMKSPTARAHHGFSAGSYRDLTRVAKLDENMWTELFLANSDCLLTELDSIINSLTEYKKAIEENDAKELCRLLREGRIIKEETDG